MHEGSGLEGVVERAHLLLDEDRAAPALEVLEIALAARVGAGDVIRAEAMGLAAVAARALGRLHEARAWSDRALEHWKTGAADGASVHAQLLEDRAELELSARAPASAAAFLRRAIALCDEHALDAPSAQTWLALAEAEQACGRDADAGIALAQAESRAAAEDDEESRALAMEMRGDLELAAADADAAARTYEAAEQRWRALRDPDGIERCLVGRARAAERRDDVDAIERVCAELDAIGASDTAARLRAGDIG